MSSTLVSPEALFLCVKKRLVVDDGRYLCLTNKEVLEETLGPLYHTAEARQYKSAWHTVSYGPAQLYMTFCL